MIKAKFTQSVEVKNGRIFRSVPIGLELASPEQAEAIKTIRPVLHTWLKTRIKDVVASNIRIVCKYAETSSGLTVEFKIQSAIPVG